MNENNLEYRMYGLVPYNLSPIQQGIQFGHGVVEYMMVNMNKPETQIWANRDKTFIILNGGTTNLNYGRFGTLNKHADVLEENGIIISKFYEPDLGDQLTSINFLVDERIWNYEKYPSQFVGGSVSNGFDVYYMPETDEEYVKRLGGEKNVWLRNFLKQFKLA